MASEHHLTPLLQILWHALPFSESHNQCYQNWNLSQKQHTYRHNTHWWFQKPSPPTWTRTFLPPQLFRSQFRTMIGYSPGPSALAWIRPSIHSHWLPKYHMGANLNHQAPGMWRPSLLNQPGQFPGIDSFSHFIPSVPPRMNFSIFHDSHGKSDGYGDK